MAKYNSLAELFTAIADAIRTKTGGTNSIVAEDFPTEIEGIMTGGYDKYITSISSNATMVDEYAFHRNDSIISASFPLATTIGGFAFSHCYYLTTVSIPSASYIGPGAFSQCHRLVTVDISKTDSIYNATFSGCYSLAGVVLRSEVVCSLVFEDTFDECPHFMGTIDTNFNPNGLKDGYFYVPSHLVEDYRVATNWAKFADQFRALEDYTVDGTTTGALDESKI